MTKNRTHPIEWMWTLFATATLSLVFAGNASAGIEEVEKARFQERYAELIQSVASAEVRVSKSGAAYTKARQRNRLKGEYRELIMTEMEAAEAELARLQKELVAFPEDARRAGVPPGWLREVEDRS
jgi:hypothetical protein